jgi:outer membrane lipoprotein-sorting protein
VKLEHRGGNRSEIKLSNIELGSALPDELFRFVAPPNTDRINPEE